LVENAIRHGIEPQRSPGIISIEAKHEGQQLHLVVRDSGRGFPSEDVNGSERLASHGIGLSNTRARLLGLYGRNQSFFFGKCDPQGCRVDIRLPFHSQPMKVLAATNEPVA
jgi:sensor histidine kinase YesM